MSLPDLVQSFSQTIAARPDGLKAFVYSTSFGSVNELQLFTDDSDFRAVQFVGMPIVNSLVAEFTDGSLIMADVSGSGVQLCEYQLSDSSNWSPASTAIMGNADSRAPAILRLKNGQVVVVSYRHDSTVTLDAALFSPASGGLPNPLTHQLSSPPSWAIKEVVLDPSPSIIPSIQIVLAEGDDGNIWGFFTRDSSHTVKLFRLTPALDLIDYHDDFLSDNTINGKPRDGAMSPEEEFPFLAIAKDGERILISYNQSRLIYSENRCDTVMTRPVVVSVGTDLSRQLVYTGPEVVNRSLCRNPIFVTVGGLYTLYSFIDLDCSYHWRIAIGNQPYEIGTANFSQAVATSTDGWIAYREPFNGSSEPIVIGSLPFIRMRVASDISGQGKALSLSWPGVGQLEQSSDLINWQAVPGVGPGSSAMIDSAAGKLFYRVNYTSQ